MADDGVSPVQPANGMVQAAAHLGPNAPAWGLRRNLGLPFLPGMTPPPGISNHTPGGIPFAGQTPTPGQPYGPQAPPLGQHPALALMNLIQQLPPALAAQLHQAAMTATR
jgi:hypothetical protein